MTMLIACWVGLGLWQTLNLLDCGQTITIARNPGKWQEIGFPTNALIGPHPEQSAVYLVMGSYAAGHALVTTMLILHASLAVAVLWLAVSFPYKLFCVVKNAKLGIKPWAPVTAPLQPPDIP